MIGFSFTQQKFKNLPFDEFTCCAYVLLSSIISKPLITAALGLLWHAYAVLSNLPHLPTYLLLYLVN